MIQQGTHYVLPNEPCFNLSERDFMSPMGQVHRYRIYVVVRGDKLVPHYEDMGPASDRTKPPIRIPGGVIDPVSKRIYIEHTVNQLREIMDSVRARQAWDYSDMPSIFSR